jgi:hypothetical protein
LKENAEWNKLVNSLWKKLMLSALKVKRFQPDFANATKFKETSEFRQEMLNILSALIFAGSHLAFYE